MTSERNIIYHPPCCPAKILYNFTNARKYVSPLGSMTTLQPAFLIRKATQFFHRKIQIGTKRKKKGRENSHAHEYLRHTLFNCVNFLSSVEINQRKTIIMWENNRIIRITLHQWSRCFTRGEEEESTCSQD